jgi:starch-binding outer membrane protein, SusD/RagB family
MRYCKFFFIFLLVVVILYSCNKNVLDLRPLGQLDATAVTNKQGVTALLIGAYSLLDGVGSPNTTPGSPWESAGSNWLFGSVAGSEAHKGSQSNDQTDQQSIERFTTTAGNEYILSRWGALYDGVQRCNDVLRIMRKVSSLTDADTVQFRAEALFLRAHYHFEAKKMWNNIPFVDENITYAADNYKLTNDVDIWPFIEADLKYAVAHLPNSQDQIGRANHYSAEAILAKAYLFQHKFDSAKILLDEIIASGKYSLKKYADNFNATTKNNEESVFAAQSSVNDGGQGNNGNVGDVLNQPNGNSPSGCCGFFQPSQYLVNHFKTDSVTGLPDLDNFNEVDVKNDIGLFSSDPFDPYGGTLDPRLDWTVGRRGIPYLDWGLHPGQDWIREQSSGGPYSPKKTSIYVSQVGSYTDASYWTVGANAININLIRYADILLWAAEAEVMSTNGSLAKAQDYVNQVRNRAADPSGWVYKYKDDQNPSLGNSDTPAARYFIKQYPGVWTDTGFAMKAIRYERMLELGMEGHRFFDLVRWGIAEHDINLYLEKEKNITGYLNGAVFNPAQDSYFPIPQSEIDKSDHMLKQNPNY